jgi:hypothetical protein
LRGLRAHGGADRGQRAETAELAAERDGIVDRAAAGIQHDGGSRRAGDPWANSSNSLGLSDVTMPTAETQPLQSGWHRIPT